MDKLTMHQLSNSKFKFIKLNLKRSVLKILLWN